MQQVDRRAIVSDISFLICSWQTVASLTKPCRAFVTHVNLADKLTHTRACTHTYVEGWPMLVTNLRPLLLMLAPLYARCQHPCVLYVLHYTTIRQPRSPAFCLLRIAHRVEGGTFIACQLGCFLLPATVTVNDYRVSRLVIDRHVYPNDSSVFLSLHVVVHFFTPYSIVIPLSHIAYMQPYDDTQHSYTTNEAVSNGYDPLAQIMALFMSGINSMSDANIYCTKKEG